MSYYASYTDMGRQLMSRVKLRGNRIATLEMWRTSYRAMGRMKDFRSTNEALEIHRREQHLDKALLKMVQQIAYQAEQDDALFKYITENSYPLEF